MLLPKLSQNPLLLLLLGGGTAVHNALAQFVAPPTTLKEVMGHAGVSVRYKEVPAGICEQDPDVKSFSGYADVGLDEHIFWWFFEARNEDPSEAPLTVWINGGPGSSSMIGLFEELGPCGVDYFGNVYNNPHSWTNASNMLFIDQPSQVGFSYSKPVPGWTASNGDIIALPDATCPDYAPAGSCGTFAYPNLTLTANSTEAAAPNFWKTLQGFMGAFPQYARGGFHFATESYGGHYGPVFNAYIERQNERNITGAKPIQLESVLIGNGWYDPIVGYQAYYNFSVSPGNTYDYAPFNASTAAMFYNNMYGPGNCLDRLKWCKETGDNAACRHADSFCAAQVESVYDNVLGRDEYDVRELTPDPFPYSFYQDYLNTAEVQAAIGAFTNFSSGSGAVGEAFGNTGDDSREAGTIEALRYLLSRNITVALYAGDADYNCNWLGNEVVAGLVGADGFTEAGYADLATSDGVVHGQVKQAGRFSFTRIYESGHEVPFYQPLAALEYFGRAIRGHDIQTGSHVVNAAYRTKGPQRSTYREGNGTVQWDVTPENSTYNVETNKPGPPWQQSLVRRAFRSPPRRRLSRFRR